MTILSSTPSAIKFGTDGWRARIADDFTFDNLQLVTEAFINYLKASQMTAPVAIGYDNRFQSETFAKHVARICSGAGIKVQLFKAVVSSPTTSFHVNQNNLAAGIMITASHNPPEWNGFKIKESFGGSAWVATTAAIEKNLKTKPTVILTETNIKLVDPKPAYFAKLKSLVNREKIKKANLNMIIDPMFGSGIGYFKELGLAVTEIRNYRDPLFGGVNPEPLPINLEDTFSFVRESSLVHQDKLTACIILDGDADRVAAIDATGAFINTHQVLTLLIYHLVNNRQMSGDIIKTFNISQLVDKLCQKYHRKLYVTPIGFKHVAKLMMEKDILIGGEESGGMGIKGYIPERDGVLMGLLLFELMAYENKTLGQILDEIMQKLGYFYYDRTDLHTEKAQDIVKKLKTAPPKEFAGKKVAQVEDLDGLKFYFENESWILFRASGTELLLRIYVEGRTPNEVKQILGAGEALLSL